MTNKQHQVRATRLARLEAALPSTYVELALSDFGVSTSSVPEPYRHAVAQLRAAARRFANA